ncbi:MAG: hypothetical protein GC206_10465 [Alphaproteobacteria bacterium]|nr:hypothetical protein [Alphaproteobacteria bacterium]
MTSDAVSLPPDVLEALETLECATSPADLGRPYQTLLNWRRKAPLVSLRRVLETGAIMALAVLLVFGSRYVLDLPVNEFWRGVLTGVWMTTFLFLIGDVVWRRRDVEPTFRERVDVALDRWRHLAPAMRELPR